MPVLWAYARDLFQTPGFGDTVDFDHIKRHYYQRTRRSTRRGSSPWAPTLRLARAAPPRGAGRLAVRSDGTAPEPLAAPLRPLPPLDM